MYKLAVVGNPIAHSLSPNVFAAFAKQCSIDLVYTRVLAKDNTDFKYQVQSFFAQGGLALNVTSPFKQQAYLLSMLPTMRAKFCQAVNFLRLDQYQQIIADTTDGIGLVRDIQLNKQVTLADKKILIIGSGFVWDSILLDFITHDPQRVDILARNQERVQFLSKNFATGAYNPTISYDIIINSSPNTTENELFAQIQELKDGAFCYDLAYAKTATMFLSKMQAKNAHIECYNGLGMLVEQARVAFVKLFGVTPDTAKVIAELSRIE